MGVADGLQLVAVGVTHIGRIVVWTVVRSRARLTLVPSPVLESLFVE